MRLLLSRLGRRPGRTARHAITFTMAVTLALISAVAVTAGTTPTRPIAVNQTDGFAQGEVVVFTYSQQFACIHEPFDDLDGTGHTGDGHVAAVDPDEFQTPKCIIGSTASGSLPTIDPAGRPIGSTERLWVIVPFFESANDADTILEALDPTPGVDVQCPEPGPPLTQHTGAFGTCTMHPTTLHAEPAGLGDLPLVNHSHLIRGKNFGSVWWQILVVLVTDESIWPDVDGNCPAGGSACLTSLEALRQAEATGQAIGDVPTNFFLFFDSRELQAN